MVRANWHWLSISIHWITVILVISLFVLGLWMVDLTYYDDWYTTAPEFHNSFGIVLFGLTVFRIIWLKLKGKPKALASLKKNEIKLAKWVHRLIYFLLFSIMLLGYLIPTANGKAIEVFGFFDVPAIIVGFDKQEDIAGLVHLWFAIVLISIVSLHGLFALKHHFINKDRTLKRMLGQS